MTGLSEPIVVVSQQLSVKCKWNSYKLYYFEAHKYTHSLMIMPPSHADTHIHTFLCSVFRNGDILSPAMRLIIPRTLLKNLEQILSLVSEKAMLRTGAVRR